MDETASSRKSASSRMMGPASSYMILQQHANAANMNMDFLNFENATPDHRVAANMSSPMMDTNGCVVSSNHQPTDHCNLPGGFHDGVILPQDAATGGDDDEYIDDWSELHTLEGAAYQSRMAPDKMCADEIRAFPDVIEHTGLIPIYLHIRNSILKYWYQRPRNQLLLEEIHRRLDEPFNRDHVFVGRVFYFLERFGYINFGIFKIEHEILITKKPKIIVIGAGMAGLIAARQLLYFGFDVFILESRNRIGGRVCTFKEGKFIADVGATLITGLGGNPIRVLEKQITMRMKPIDQKCPLYIDYRPIDHAKDEALETVFNSALEGTSFLSKVMKFDRIGAKPLSLGDALEIVLELQDREVKQQYLKYASEIASLEEKIMKNYQQMKTLQDCMDTLYEKHRDYVQSKTQRTIKQDYQYRVNRYQLNQAIVKFNQMKDNVKRLEDRIRAIEAHEPPRQYLSSGDRRILDWHFANLEYACATSLFNLSNQNWDQDEAFEFTGPQISVKNGYSCIPYALAGGLETKLNTVVRSIKMTPTGVEVEAVHIDRYNHMYDNAALRRQLDSSAANIYHADAVLCTVPLGALKNSVELSGDDDGQEDDSKAPGAIVRDVNRANAIRFIPPLPEAKASAIRRLGFGNLNKVVLIFESVFWDRNINLFGNVPASESTRGEVFLYWAVYKQPVLIALIAGEAADRMEKTRDEIIKSKCLEILGGIHPNISPLKSYYVTRWRSDPWAQGAFSYTGTEASGDDFDTIAESVSHPAPPPPILPVHLHTNKEPPMIPRLFFAGEHTIRQYPATVHGALLSGVREAAKIANQFLGVPYQLKKI